MRRHMHIGSKPKLSRVAVGMLALLVAVQVLPPFLGLDSPFGWATGLQAQNNPTACDAVGSNWTNCQDAFSSNDVYASANLNPSVPGGSTPVTVQAGAGADPTINGQRHVYKATGLADNRYFAFYYSGSNLVWEASDDSTGDAWTGSLNAVFSTTQNFEADALAVLYDPSNQKVHVALSAPGESDLRFRRGTVGTAGGISWDFADVVFGLGDPGEGGAALFLGHDESGNPDRVWFFYDFRNRRWQYKRSTVASTGALDNTGNWIAEVDVSCGPTNNNRGPVFFVTRASGDPRAVFYGTMDGTTSLWRAEWSGATASTVWSCTEITSTVGGTNPNRRLSGVSLGTVLHIVYLDGSDLLKYRNFDLATGTDSGETTVDGTNAYQQVALSTDGTKLYAFTRGSSDGDIYRYERDGGSWGSRILTLDEAATTPAGSLNGDVEMRDNIVSVLYANDAGANDDVRFAKFDLFGVPGSPGKNDTAWRDFGFSFNPSDVIDTVEVGVEWFRTSSEPILNVTVSWDGGATWATNQTATNKSADDDTVEFLDFTSATAWDITKLNDANFRVRVGTNASDARLDLVTARVNYNVAPLISNFRIQDPGTVQSQRDPTACEAVGDNWTNCQDAFVSDGAYAYANDTVAASGLSVKVDSFTRQTGTGNQAVTGVGFTPKVVIFWGTIKTAEGFSADLSHFQGFMVSATEQRALANFGTGGGAAGRLAQKAIVIISDNTPTTSAEADFVSFDADGFTLDWTTNDGTQNIIHYMALGGADLASVKVGHFVANDVATGTQAITGVGFQPKMVFMMGHGRIETIPSSQTRGNFFGGYAVSSTERATLSWATRDTTGRHATNQRTDRVIIASDQTGTNRMEADFVSMDSDGFTVNWLQVDRALIIPYLAMAGAELNVKVGSFNSATATGNQAVTGTGFQPDLVRLMTWSEPASTAILTDTKAAYGAATSPTEQGVAGVLREDATPANADDYTLTTKAIRLADPGAPPTTLAEADFVSFDTDGFTLDWTTADATAREILYWAVGGSGGIAPGMNDTAWKDFGFALGADGINTVEIGVEWFRNNTAPVLTITISWNGGSTWALSQTAANKSVDDNTVEFLDFTSATQWTASKLNDTNLRVRVSTNASGARVDYTTVRVSHTPSRAGTQLDVDTEYDYLFNVTDADGWSDIATDGNVSLNLWYDGGGSPTTDQRDPTACAAIGNDWTNCQDAFSSDNLYSYANDSAGGGGSASFNYFDPIEVTPGTASAWIEVDASPYIPLGATGVILHITTSGSEAYGVRKNGSMDNRVRYGFGAQHNWAMIGVDTNRVFEANVASTTNVDIWLLGYTGSGVTFFTDAPDKSLGSTGSWIDIDISGNTGADTAIGAIIEYLDTSGSGDFGLRMNGSSDNRVLRQLAHPWAIVGVDANEILEGQITDLGDDFFLVGYVTEGAVFKMNADDISIGSINTYVDIDISGLTGSNTANGAFIEVFNANPGPSRDFALRKNGSAEDIFKSVEEHTWGFVEVDGNEVLEGKIDSTAVDFYLVGYSLAGSGGNDFKIQRGQITIPTSQSTVTITAGTDYVAPASLSNAFISIVGTFLTASGDDTGQGSPTQAREWMTSISNPGNLLTSITFERYLAVATDTTRIYWEIIEYIGPVGGANELIVRDQADIEQGAMTFVGATEASSTTSTLTLNVPSGVQDNDILIAVLTQSDDEDGNWNTLSGWTMVVTDHPVGATPPSIAATSAYWRVANSEPGSYAFTVTNAGGVGTVGKMMAFRGGDTTTPMDATPTTAQGSGSSTPDPPSITTVTDGAFVIAIGFADDDLGVYGNVPAGYTDPGGLGTVVTAGGGNGASLGVAYQEISPAGAENPGTFEFTDPDEWGTITIALRPASGASIDGASVAPTDDADVVVFITGQRADGASAGDTDRGLYTSEWVTASNIPRFTRGDGTGTASVSYAVVEFTGSNWIVQRAEHTYVASGVEETETITAVNSLSRTFLHAQIRTASGNVDEMGQRVHLSATTTVSFQLRSGAGIASQVGVAWVVENTQTDGTPMNVQRVSGSRTGGGGNPDEWTETITAVSDLLATSIMGETSDSSGTGNSGPRGATGLDLTATTTVTLWRSDGGNMQDYRFEVVEWPTASSGGGGGPGNNDTAWRDFGFALSGSITQVEVGVEWWRNNTAPILNVSISWDGGTTWATNQLATNKSADDNTVEFLDFTSATAWTPAKLNDANLRVRVGTNASGARLDYVTVRATSSSGELTFSQQTTGANYRIVLTYLDTADPTTASLSEWSVTEGRATYNASASGLTAILSGPTIIGYEFRLALKFGFQVKHAVAPTNNTVGAYNDLDSWNAEVVATDGPHTITLQEASTGEHMEFGVFMYTFVNISADWTVNVFHGSTDNTNIVTVFRRSNDDFTLRIWFVTDLIKGGDTIPITNVQILAAGDLTDDITVDTAFAGLGEGNAVYILGSATLWFSHSTDTDEDTTTVQFSVTVALGTPLGTYTAELTIRIQQQP